MVVVHSDIQILGCLANLRVATIQQLAIVLDRNSRALQRRLRSLQEAQLVEVLSIVESATTYPSSASSD